MKTTETETQTQPTLKKAFVPIHEFLSGLASGTTVESVMDDLTELMRSRKGSGGGTGRRVIRQVFSANGELFALRCRATGKLFRLTDANDELVFAQATRSNTGYAHACLAVSEHKVRAKESYDAAAEKLRAKAMKAGWSLSEYDEKLQELEGKYLNAEVDIPASYIEFETPEAAQEAAG